MSAVTTVLLYGLFVLGAVGVYFALPRRGRSTLVAGAIFGLAAVAGLLVLIATRIGAAHEADAYFYIFSAVALVGAGRVVTHPKPVYSAVYFVLVVVAVAFLLVLQAAEFLAAAVVIVYAGAIMVTYVFVIMLAQQSGAPGYDTRAREPFLAVLAGFVLMAAVAARLGEPIGAVTVAPMPETMAVAGSLSEANATGAEGDAESTSEVGNTVAVGRLLMSRYVVALEIAGVLLLVAMVGAIVLARKRVPAELNVPSPVPIDKIGREVAPF